MVVLVEGINELNASLLPIPIPTLLVAPSGLGFFGDNEVATLLMAPEVSGLPSGPEGTDGKGYN